MPRRMPSIVSTPKNMTLNGNPVTSCESKNFKPFKGAKAWKSADSAVEAAEIQGRRDYQEDAFTISPLPSKLLEMKPEALAHRLWTTMHILNDHWREKRTLGLAYVGTTASTTVYVNGKLITSTLAESCAFAIAYDKEGYPLKVIRLNSTTHSTTDSREVERLKSLNVEVHEGRVPLPQINPNLFAGINITRAIGDSGYGPGIAADSAIDIHDINDLKAKMGGTDVDRIDVVTVCDGYIDGAGKNAKAAVQEAFIMNGALLYQAYCNCGTDRLSFAEFLVKQSQGFSFPPTIDAIYKQYKQLREARGQVVADKASLFKTDQPCDNVTVVKTPVMIEGRVVPEPFLVGVYDGHGGFEVSSHTAENVVKTFINQCKLSPAEYATQTRSVLNHLEEYRRDNPSMTADDSVISTRGVCQGKDESVEYLSDLQKLVEQLGQKHREVSAFLKSLQEFLPVDQFTPEWKSLIKAYKHFMIYADFLPKTDKSIQTAITQIVECLIDRTQSGWQDRQKMVSGYICDDLDPSYNLEQVIQVMSGLARGEQLSKLEYLKLNLIPEAQEFFSQYKRKIAGIEPVRPSIVRASMYPPIGDSPDTTTAGKGMSPVRR